MYDLELNNNVFESIKHIDELGNEYWSARELMPIFQYAQWRRFHTVIEKAKLTCTNSKNNVDNHFANVGKMVITGDSKRNVEDYKLSRYACYLIAQNGDSRKKSIALAKTYFAVQTRRQELIEKDYNEITEDEKKIYSKKTN